ncbi:MAG: YeeE/YedE thiosulfate transporter family protein [Ginsengibacter sp.]
MHTLLKQAMPWYIAGPLIGLMVPALLIIGNKTLGISSSLRHICAACLPAKIPFFEYNWKKEEWNLFFACGIFLGGLIAGTWLLNPAAPDLNPALIKTLSHYGITGTQSLLPEQLFNWHSLLTVKGLIFIVAGGFLVGFGTRYAGGCTSGHSIMGLSSLQPSSLIATACFMAGGFIMTNLILPFILSINL